MFKAELVGLSVRRKSEGDFFSCSSDSAPHYTSSRAWITEDDVIMQLRAWLQNSSFQKHFRIPPTGNAHRPPCRSLTKQLLGAMKLSMSDPIEFFT